MKKLLAVLLCVSVFTACFALTGCRRDEVKINESMTQLYIHNYNAGFGGEWLDPVIAAFEEKYKDVQFQEGKRGVEVFVDNEATIPNPTDVRHKRDSILVLEQRDYYNYISSGALADITDLVKKKMTEFGEDRSMEEKMLAYNVNAPNYFRTLSGQYYGVPFHEGFYCITYDMDVFHDHTLYFAASTDNGEVGWTKDGEKSLGPDGKVGTLDDGMPATYDQFMLLLTRMKDNGVIPFHWAGKYIEYTRSAMYNWWADYEGEKQMMLNSTFSGKAEDLVVFNPDGSVKLGADGRPVTESLDITQSNGYELQRQAGKYYALSLAKRIVSDSSNYTNIAFSGSESHKQAESTYINSSNNGTPIAFLIDGNYWMREATDAFTDMVNTNGEEFSKENRRFAILPIPKATPDKVGEPQTVTGGLSSCLVMNASVADDPVKKDLAEKFMMFLHTEEALKTFTRVTNCTRPFDYDFSPDEERELNTYARSMWDLHKNGKILNPLSSSLMFVNNYSEFLDLRTCFNSVIDGQPYYAPFSAFKHNGFSVDQYLQGMLSYKRSAFGSLNL